MKKQFVLVSLDFPKQHRHDERTRTTNRRLAAIYGVNRFPTAILAEASGYPIARMHYHPSGSEFYLKKIQRHLIQFEKERTIREHKFAAAATASGLEKATLLHEGLSAMTPTQKALFFRKEVEELLEADPQDILGVKKEMAIPLLMAQLKEYEEATPPQMDQWMTAVETFIKENNPEGEDKQKLLLIKFQALMANQQVDKLETLLKEIIAIDTQTETAKNASTIQRRLPTLIRRVQATTQIKHIQPTSKEKRDSEKDSSTTEAE